MIYEYKCDECDIKWTEFRAVADMEKLSMCDNGHAGKRIISPCGLIFNSDSFPSQALKGGKFWLPDGRNMYFKENEFLQKEAADDAMAKPETCVNVAKQKVTTVESRI